MTCFRNYVKFNNFRIKVEIKIVPVYTGINRIVIYYFKS